MSTTTDASMIFRESLFCDYLCRDVYVMAQQLEVLRFIQG